MKNVHHDIEIENDTVESMEDEPAMPQFRREEGPKKRRRVEYDEHGRVRKDYSNKWIKIGILVIFIVLVNLYVVHMCGDELIGLANL